MTKPLVLRSVLAAAMLSIAAACSGGSAPAPQPSEHARYHATMLSRPIPMPSAVLTDSRGRPFDLRARTDGYVTLVLFGYTNCPDVCPVHLANLTAALRQAGNIPRNQLRVLFITTDPARDTPARLRQWMSHFDHTFIGLTGPKAVLDSLQREMQLPVAVKEASNSAGDYAVGHAAQVLVFTRDDRAHLAYPFGTKQQDWVDDLPRLLKETWGTPGGSSSQQS